MMALKVPKCEISISWILVIFYTIKPPWVGDFGTVKKIRNCFVLVMISKFFPAKNFQLVHAEPALKKFVLRARSKIKKCYGCF